MGAEAVVATCAWSEGVGEGLEVGSGEGATKRAGGEGDGAGAGCGDGRLRAATRSGGRTSGCTGRGATQARWSSSGVAPRR